MSIGYGVRCTVRLLTGIDSTRYKTGLTASTHTMYAMQFDRGGNTNAYLLLQLHTCKCVSVRWMCDVIVCMSVVAFVEPNMTCAHSRTQRLQWSSDGDTFADYATMHMILHFRKTAPIGDGGQFKSYRRSARAITILYTPSGWFMVRQCHIEAVRCAIEHFN